MHATMSIPCQMTKRTQAPSCASCGASSAATTETASPTPAMR